MLRNRNRKFRLAGWRRQSPGLSGPDGQHSLRWQEAALAGKGVAWRRVRGGGFGASHAKVKRYSTGFRSGGAARGPVLLVVNDSVRSPCRDSLARFRALTTRLRCVVLSLHAHGYSAMGTWGDGYGGVDAQRSLDGAALRDRRFDAAGG